MEEEGCFYYFKHEDGKHTLVIADRATEYYDLPEKEVDYPDDFGSQAIDNYVTSWEHRYAFATGKWAQTDFNFTTPSESLMTQADTVVKLPSNTKFEVYDYPGTYGTKGDGQPLTDVRMEAEEAAHDVVVGSSLCRTFSPGGKFKIVQHRSKAEAGKKYVITSIEHHARETMAYEAGENVDFDYRNQFTAIPDSVPFRAERSTRKPFVQGVQTATIVGPKGEEIYTDKYGRVKAQFHWDREGKKDENSSCWMRVSQIHAGKGFGAIDIPRMGEEVIVSFLEGDPDRPIITGRVYHAENMPPFGLPDKKVVSGLKSKTYKGTGYNEYVMDDTPGNELIREHGQYDKDSTIENDLREHVLNNRSRDVTVDETVSVGNNQSISIGVDRTIQVGANHTETIGSNMAITIGSNLTETVAINYAETVGAAMQLTVGAVMTQTIGAAYILTIGAGMTMGVGSNLKTTIGSNRGEQVGGKVTEKVGGNVSQQYGGKHTEKVSGKYLLNSGAAVTVQAADQIVLKTGAASITMKKSGDITIKGTKITIEGSAKIVEKSAMISSEASAKNLVKGAMVNVEASAINTIKGALVKIN
jgi:type VI secretion system secreted protein VgrG